MPDTIHLYGDIGSAMWFEGITDTEVVQQLRTLDIDAEKHYVRINSIGGLTAEGISIMNVLRAHKNTMKAYNEKFQLETVVDGYAMSAASLIYMAGDIRSVALGGVLMIHDAWSYLGGNAAECRKVAEQLDKVSDNAAGIYASLCSPDEKRTKDYFRTLMQAETYFTGEESLAAGLSTNIEKDLQATVSKDLTPEILKGHYVQRMMTRTKTTLSRPVNNAWLASKQDAMKLLQASAAELGISIPLLKA